MMEDMNVSGKLDGRGICREDPEKQTDKLAVMATKVSSPSVKREPSHEKNPDQQSGMPCAKKICMRNVKDDGLKRNQGKEGEEKSKNNSIKITRHASEVGTGKEIKTDEVTNKLFEIIESLPDGCTVSEERFTAQKIEQAKELLGRAAICRKQVFESTDSNGHTIMMVAVMKRHQKMVQMLLEDITSYGEKSNALMKTVVNQLRQNDFTRFCREKLDQCFQPYYGTEEIEKLFNKAIDSCCLILVRHNRLSSAYVHIWDIRHEKVDRKVYSLLKKNLSVPGRR